MLWCLCYWIFLMMMMPLCATFDGGKKCCGLSGLLFIVILSIVVVLGGIMLILRCRDVWMFWKGKHERIIEALEFTRKWLEKEKKLEKEEGRSRGEKKTPQHAFSEKVLSVIPELPALVEQEVLRWEQEQGEQQQGQEQLH